MLVLEIIICSALIHSPRFIDVEEFQTGQEMVVLSRIHLQLDALPWSNFLKRSESLPAVSRRGELPDRPGNGFLCRTIHLQLDGLPWSNGVP